jgi:hypothetical protein
MTNPVPIKHRPSGDHFLFRPYDLGLLLEIVQPDGTTQAVLIPGTFIDGLWHNGSPVLDPERTIQPIEDKDFYAQHGCNPPVELDDTPFAEDHAR